MEHFPALNADCFDQHIAERLQLHEPPRILILYGSVRECSFLRPLFFRNMKACGLQSYWRL